MEIPEGWGVIFVVKIPGRRWGLYEIPSVVGVWLFWNHTICNKSTYTFRLTKTVVNLALVSPFLVVVKLYI